MNKSLLSLLLDLPLEKRVRYFLSSLAAIAIAFYLLIVWPRVNLPANHGEYGEIKAIEHFNMVNEKRRTAVQIVGSIFFFVTAYFTLRNVLATEANAKIARENTTKTGFSKRLKIWTVQNLCQLVLGPSTHWSNLAVSQSKNKVSYYS